MSAWLSSSLPSMEDIDRNLTNKTSLRCFAQSEGTSACAILLPAAAEPRHALYIRNEPGADAENDRQQDDDVVNLTVYAASEREPDELIEVEHRVVRDEKDHAVFANKA